MIRAQLHRFIVLAIVCNSTTAAAEEPSRKAKRLIVYTPLTSDEPELKKLANIVAQDILVHLGRRGELELLGQTELDLLLKHVEDKADLSGPECERVEECLARVSAAAHAEQVLTSRLGKMGASFIATFSLSDGKTLAVERSEECSGEDVASLRAAAIAAVDALFGGATARPPPLVSLSNIQKIAVMPLSGLAESPDVAAGLTQLYGIELRRGQASPVITSDEVAAMVDHTVLREQCKGEGDMTACLVEIGMALDVSHVASGEIGRLQDTMVIALKLIDIRRAEVVNRVVESFRGEESHLPRCMFFTVNALLGRTIEGEGDLLVVTDIEGKLTLDKDEPRALPRAEPIRGLKSGKHNVAIVDNDDDYHSYFAEVFVQPGVELRFQPTLIPRDPEWYETWWFISAISVAVVAGTVTTFLLLQEEGGELGTHVGRLGVRL